MCAGGYGDDGKDFYDAGQQSPDDKMEAVLTAFKNRIMAAPVVATVTDSFKFNGGGSCPSWSTSVSLWNTSLDINLDQLCSSTIPWLVIQGIVIFMATIAGFYIAFR